MDMPKMPRGVHYDRANLENHEAIRIVDSAGTCRVQIIVHDSFRPYLPVDIHDRLWTILNAADTPADDTPPYGIRLVG